MDNLTVAELEAHAAQLDAESAMLKQQAALKRPDEQSAAAQARHAESFALLPQQAADANDSTDQLRAAYDAFVEAIKNYAAKHSTYSSTFNECERIAIANHLERPTRSVRNIGPAGAFRWEIDQALKPIKDV